MLAGLGHEIRNQLALIVGHSECCADGSLEGKRITDTLRLVFLTSRRLQSLLDVVLNLCELESSGESAQQVPVSPTALLESVRLDLGEANDRVELSIHGPIPSLISTDRERLKNMLRLVLLSSLEECGPRGLRLEVSVVESDPGNAALFMDVIAVDPQHPYLSVAGVSDLGFQVSNSLCEAIGGELSVLRRIGTPAEVRILLPAGPLAELRMMDAKNDLNLDMEILQLRPLEGARILVAEDDEDNQELIRYILDRAGAGVTVASNGLQAVEIVEKNEASGSPFDLILMDLEMPVLSGYLATQQIRAKGHDLPIVAFSGNSDPASSTSMKDTGFSYFISKSIGRAGLLKCLAEFLRATTHSSS